MFGVQVKVNGKWGWMHPANQKPYQYISEGAAQHSMEMCYPGQVKSHRLGGECVVRVKEIDDAISNQD